MPVVQSIEQNVTRLLIGEKTIHLVGTAHVSQASAELVERIITEVKPDCVAVELCESRFRALQNPDRWKNMNLIQVIREGKSYLLLSQLILAGFQKKLGNKLNVKPGAEMLIATKIAEQHGIPISLVDREVSATLKRTWKALRWWQLIKVMLSLTFSLVERREITEEEIERLKSSDALEELMAEFSKSLPDVRTTLIDERDKFLAQKIKESPGKNIVAVLGTAHIPGIINWIESDSDTAELSKVPPKSPWIKAAGWAFPVLIIGAMLYTLWTTGPASFSEMFKAWFLITGLFGALGAALARGHWITVLSAFVVAPFAALNPFIAAGWIAGLIEAVLRKPRVVDLEAIAEDLTTVRGAFTNRVSRTLLVVAFTNITVILGMAVGGAAVYSIAADEPANSAVKNVAHASMNIK